MFSSCIERLYITGRLRHLRRLWRVRRKRPSNVLTGSGIIYNCATSCSNPAKVKRERSSSVLVQAECKAAWTGGNRITCTAGVTSVFRSNAERCHSCEERPPALVQTPPFPACPFVAGARVAGSRLAPAASIRFKYRCHISSWRRP